MAVPDAPDDPDRKRERKEDEERERVGKSDTTVSTPADSAGVGPVPQDGNPPAVAPAPKKKKKRLRKARDETELNPEMQRLVRIIGRDKVVPDTTALERHYSRSLRFRHLIVEFLLENSDTTWTDISDLHARAANYAGCSSQTAARWVFQLTRVDAPFRLLEAVDHWVLERRER